MGLSLMRELYVEANSRAVFQDSPVEFVWWHLGK
jgi:hypothetical protein